MKLCWFGLDYKLWRCRIEIGFWIYFEVDIIGFVDGLDVEVRYRKFEDGFGYFGMNYLKIWGVFYWNE